MYLHAHARMTSNMWNKVFTVDLPERDGHADQRMIARWACVGFIGTGMTACIKLFDWTSDIR